MMARFEVQELFPWRQRFVSMLPAILNYLVHAFRGLGPEARDEATQEGVANSFVAYLKLVQGGKENLAFASVLARYAVAQFRAGRRVGARLNALDVSSEYGQRRKQIKVERLDRYDAGKECWHEVLLADDRRPVLDQVAFRCDFPDWLNTLPRRDRKIAQCLAAGNSTTEVARRFGLTLGRVSQLRREFERSWLDFHGELEESERMEMLAAA